MTSVPIEHQSARRPGIKAPAPQTLSDKAAIAASVLIAVAMAPLVQAEEYVEWVGANSGVNWSSGQVQAAGAGVGPQGRPPSMAKLIACRAAVLDAQRNLIESIHGVRVEGTTVVANMMVESDTIKTSVSGLLQGASVVNRTPMDDGSCEVTMTAPLGGKFTAQVYDHVFTNKNARISIDRLKGTLLATLGEFAGSASRFLIPTAKAAETRLPEWQVAVDRLSKRLSSLEDLLSTHPLVVQAQDAGPTGLVLDARGSNFIPSMTPKVRKLRAGVIYPNPKHQTALQERGQLVSLFTRDLDTARRHPVVGERPVVMKALRTWGATRTEIVLGTESSDRLAKLVKDGFLADSGVIIVL